MEHGVEDYEEFAHAGGDDDLGRFALRCQAFGEGADHWIEASSVQRDHVEDLADRGPPAFDAAFTLMSSAIAIEGRETDQGADGLTIEAAQLRQFSDERRTGDLSDPRRRAEKFDLGSPVVVGFEQASDLGFDRGDLPACPTFAGVDGCSCRRRGPWPVQDDWTP